jgi:uncharacterized protein (DUF2147 family)
MNMTRLALFALALSATLAVIARAAPADQSQVFGQWLTENKRGVIEMFPCGDKVCGRLFWMIDPLRNGKPSLDDYNPKPELRQRPLCGMTILGDFRETEPQHWEDGWIYDPDSGKTYHATMTLESNGTLRLRGYIGIPLFGESQHWTRADGSLGKC